jgi:FAD-dependent urate hydroxylase
LLGPGFESSVPGLHFVGAFAAASFGPVMRFVSVTPFTARALASHVRDAHRPAQLRPQPASAAA